jgi:hypothetical protein
MFKEAEKHSRNENNIIVLAHDAKGVWGDGRRERISGFVRQLLL